MKSLYLLTCALGSIALVSCGGDSGGSVSGNNADIQGTWVHDCKADADGDSQRFQYTFAGNEVTAANVLYIGTTECDNALTYTLGVDATFTTDGSTTTMADGTTTKNIDYVFGTAGYFSGSEQILQLLDSQGTSLEAVASSQGLDDINNIPLANIGIESSELYTIYRVDGNSLRVGDSSGGLNGTSPDLRTNRLGSDVFTRR